ncbi:hypothetical protein [Egicoccus halophilus]|uniref:Uncharacterized protein n=2 Tax=Egicoccus halophilus TaxID=1670830 RepID=A0A8J3ABN4_9ACTN|nr:hypothetical protein [Egicoccus halophilus]GGI09785.1 hypothetical protein GCM10011354_35800 [Egicoccus halophilus]
MLMASGGKRIHVGGVNAAILKGEEDVGEWDEEELWRGRRRDTAGTFRGRPPTVVPFEVHQELNRRKLDEALEVCRSSVVDAVKLWQELVADHEADMKYRLEAARQIADRVLGKPVDRTQVEVSLRPEPWREAIEVAVVGSMADVIDVEPEDDWPEWDEAE